MGYPNIDQFLGKILEIESEKPKYRSGGSGSDGTCDCIGLIIGALQRCGTKWPGIHGSNWAARNAVVRLRSIVSEKQLGRGDIVFKAYDLFDDAYDLPKRYANDKDSNDYYHVGVVLDTSPLMIKHCTSVKDGNAVRTDTKLGKWSYVATLKYIDADGSAPPGDDKPVTETMIVVCTPGQTVKLRRSASTSGEVIEKIPNGELVLAAPSAEPGWHLVTHGTKSGYMMSAFLEIPHDDGESVTLTLPLSTAKLLLQALASATGGLK